MNDEAKKNTPSSPLTVRFLSQQIFQYAPAALVPAVLGLLTSATFTRVFSTDEYGRYSLIASLTSLLAALCTQWLQQGITRYMPGADSEVRRESLKRATAWALALVACSAICTLIVLGVLLSRFVDAGWHEIVWAAVGLTIATAIFNPVLSVLQAEMRASRVTGYQSTSACLRFGFSLAFVFFCYRNPVSLVWASTCALVFLLPFIWRDARMPSLPQLHKWTDALPSMRRLATYGVPMMGWFISATLLDAGDRYILQYFRGSTEVGIYSANYSLVTGAVGLVTAPILLAAHPFLMRAWGDGDREEAGRWLGLIMTSFATLGVVLIGGVWLFAADVAHWILGSQFRDGYRVMPVVFAGLVVWQLGMYLHKPLEFTGKTKLMFYLGIVSGLFNIALNVIFVPVFGYLAAAYSTLAAYGLYALLVAIAGKHILPWRIPWRRLTPSLLLSLVALVIAMYVRRVTESHFGYLAGLSAAVVVEVVMGLTVLFALAGTFKRYSGHGQN